MKQVRHIALVIAAFAGITPAPAQTFPTVPSGTVIGRTTIGTGPAQAVPFSTLGLNLSRYGGMLLTPTPTPAPTPGHAIVFGSDPLPNTVADAGGPPLLAPLANVSLATMPAYTLKGNANASPSVPADISIPALPLKSVPVAGDIVLIQDSAASNAFKRTTEARARCRFERWQRVRLMGHPKRSDCTPKRVSTT